MKKPLEITVGGPGPLDPAAGQNLCPIPALKGQDLIISKRSVDQETGGYLKTAEFTVLAAGGFSLPVNFVAGDVYFVFEGDVLYASGGSTWTNGFNLTRVMAALFGRIGWRQETIAGAPVADADNASSRSGRYFQDFHPLATLFNFKQIQEDKDASDAELNARLESMQRGAIMQALTGVLNAPERLESGLDFIRYGEQNDRAINNGDLFVGRRITPGRLEDVAIAIEQVSLLFDGDVTFPLYLFQEGRKAPIWTAEVTAIAEEKTVVDLTDVVLNFLSSTHLGGAYYLGYFQQDLGAVRAIDESRIGQGCSNLWTMELIESQRTGVQTFNRTNIQGSPWSHGLNVRLTAFKDWTNGVAYKAALFDELIGLQISIMFLEKAIYSTRSNPTERILKDQLLTLGVFDLTGTSPGVPDAPKTEGLRQQIKREIERVRKSFIPNHRAISYPIQ